MTMLDSAKCPAEFVGLRAWVVRTAAKRALMAVAFGVTSSVALIHAEEPPGLVQEKQAPPVRDGFARAGGRGQWHDPEFIEDRKWFHFLLDNRAKIRMEITDTEKGVRVVEISDDRCLVSLIQTHAGVVGQFIKNGHDEVRGSANNQTVAAFAIEWKRQASAVC